jgi:tagatose-1,6-bisphosphate aldolase non-catalytic subunit AgaZ/GatZ
MTNHKWGFDGQGINDYSDEYKPRVATLTTRYKSAEIGTLLAAAPDLLKALVKSEQNIIQLCNMVNQFAGFTKAHPDDFAEQTRAAIAKATKESK